MAKNKIIKICDFIIEYGILAIVFFIPIIIDFTVSSYNIVDLFKVVFFRVILSFISLAYLLKIFAIGKLNYRGNLKIFFFIAILFASFFISSFFSLDPKQSFWGDFSRMQGFYNFFNYLLFFVLIVLNIKDFKQIKKIIITVIFSAFLAAVYGFIQFFNLDFISWQEMAAKTGRIFSTLGQPNFFGHYLIMVLPFSLYALIFMAKRFLVRFFIGLVLLAQSACLIFTYSRAAWLGFFGSIAFLLFVWLIYSQRRKMIIGFIVLLLIGTSFIISLNLIGLAEQSNTYADSNIYSINILANRLKSVVDFSGGSNKMRLNYLTSAVKEIKKANLGRLLVGFGPETLAGIFRQYYRSDWGIYENINDYPDRAHNWIFDKILALGFLGLIANLLFYIYFIKKAVQFLFFRKKFGPEEWLLVFLSASLVAYFVNNLFSFSLFTVSVYLYLILALGWSVINYRLEEKVLEIKFTNFSKILIWLAYLTVTIIFLWTNNINQVRAEINFQNALKSFNLSDCFQVMDNMEKVINLSPYVNYYQEHYIFLLLNCFPSLEKPTQINWSENLLTWIKYVGNQELYGLRSNTARLYTLIGFYLDKAYYEKAEKIYKSIIADFPYFTTAYEDYGRQKMWQKDYSGAIQIYKRALEILPPIDNSYLNEAHQKKIASITVRLYEGLGQAYFQVKNYDQALMYYQEGLKLDPYRSTLYKNIADIYYFQGQLDRAVSWNKRGLMLSPNDYHWYLSLSLLYRDQKNIVEAKNYLNRALILAPDNQDLKNYYEELKKK
jgi:tetratricopeptide (TPR) repeat protein/O-antigen ligase